MHCIVTGGAGFIGTNLCLYLLAEGYRVTCVDNFSSGCKENISGLLKNPKFSLLRHDVCKPLPKSLRGDFLFHLACPASPKYYQADPIKTLSVTFDGTRNCLEHCRKGYVRRVLLASTSEIYGEPLEHPQSETYRGNVSTTGPRACYDEGKRIAEVLMLEYSRCHGIQVRIARIFNSFGPYLTEGDGRIVSTFIRQCLDGDPISIFGDGSQTRTLCYVTDTVRGLVALMLHKSFTGPVNIGGTEELTVKQIAELVIACAGKNHHPIDYKTLPVDDPSRRKPNLWLAREQLGWQPIFTTKEGIKKTVQWFVEHRQCAQARL